MALPRERREGAPLPKRHRAANQDIPGRKQLLTGLPHTDRLHRLSFTTRTAGKNWGMSLAEEV
jgi:hypothetical protein